MSNAWNNFFHYFRLTKIDATSFLLRPIISQPPIEVVVVKVGEWEIRNVTEFSWGGNTMFLRRQLSPYYYINPLFSS